MSAGRTLVGITAPMLNADTCQPVATLGFDTIAATVSGTFGAGGSVALEGSIDNVTFSPLVNSLGVAIAITAAGIVFAHPACAVRYARLRVTAGDGTTSLIGTIFQRTQSRY
jgi:hypothetical protein